MVRLPWRRRTKTYSETDRIRQGTGPLDNFVVLIVSVSLLAIAGVSLIYWYSGAPG